MIGSIVRSLIAVVAGIATALAGLIAVETLSAVVHPVPPGVDITTDIAACKAHVARYPTWVLGVVVVLWGLTAFAGAWVATRLGTSRHPVHGLVVGSLLLAAAVFNMAMLPYPAWFWINVLVLPAAAILGARLARGNKPAAN